MTDVPVTVTRQAISLPGGSCGMRVGSGAIERLGRELRIVVGRPRKVALVATATQAEDLMTEVTRLLTDADFVVCRFSAGDAAPLCSVASAQALYRDLAREGITADDALVAVGDSDLLSLCSFVSATWCAGMPLVDVPTTQDACILGTFTPRALDIDGDDEMVSAQGYPSQSFCDLDHISGGEGMARSLMVATAVADSDDGFSRLAARIGGIVANDAATLSEQLIDTAKCRGRIVSATSVAVRHGILYGQTFARGLSAALGGDVDPALVRAEGLRFTSRVAASMGEDEKGADLVFAQDALLDELGLPEIPCDLDPDDLRDSLRSTCFKRTNRFLFALPLALGRVRLTPVDEELLAEHLTAFCASRARLVADGDE